MQQHLYNQPLNPFLPLHRHTPSHIPHGSTLPCLVLSFECPPDPPLCCLYLMSVQIWQCQVHNCSRNIMEAYTPPPRHHHPNPAQLLSSPQPQLLPSISLPNPPLPPISTKTSLVYLPLYSSAPNSKNMFITIRRLALNIQIPL